ncbi:MAG: TrkA family potassium uptake protein [Deltaproteobacteria bacterium]|nr:TrkA family potassium uptake protein [Deltaproteobacteria bacterium]
MYIVIAGGGIAGSSLAAELVNHKHDVVVIDTDRQACENLYANTGVVAVNGRATEIEPLKEAGIAKADIAIGALYRDVDNLTFSLLAHSFGVEKIMVKMRDPSYEEAYKIAGVTSICSMMRMFQTKIITELETSDFKVIAHLRHGRTQLVMFETPASWPRDGIKICDLAAETPFANSIFAGILHMDAEKIAVPHGDYIILPGDRVFMVAETKNLNKMAKFLHNRHIRQG